MREGGGVAQGVITGRAKGWAEKGGREDGDNCDAGSCLGRRLGVSQGVSTAQAAGFIHVKSNGISPSSFPNDDRGPFEL